MLLFIFKNPIYLSCTHPYGKLDLFIWAFIVANTHTLVVQVVQVVAVLHKVTTAMGLLPHSLSGSVNLKGYFADIRSAARWLEPGPPTLLWVATRSHVQRVGLTLHTRLTPHNSEVFIFVWRGLCQDTNHVNDLWFSKAASLSRHLTRVERLTCIDTNHGKWGWCPWLGRLVGEKHILKILSATANHPPSTENIVTDKYKVGVWHPAHFSWWICRCQDMSVKYVFIFLNNKNRGYCKENAIIVFKSVISYCQRMMSIYVLVMINGSFLDIGRREIDITITSMATQKTFGGADSDQF